MNSPSMVRCMLMKWSISLNHPVESTLLYCPSPDKHIFSLKLLTVNKYLEYNLRTHTTSARDAE